jgi:ribosome maturation factor RimP
VSSGFRARFFIWFETMSEQAVESRIREIATEVATRSGLEFVHSEVVGSRGSMTVRVFIDKPDGVSHADCEKVSRDLSAVLDSDDLITHAFILEVSSPGLERGLYSSDDFARFAGSAAKVKTKTAVNGQRNFRGKIIAVEDGAVVFEDRTNGVVRFPYADVVKANLEIDLEEELKKH